MDKDNTLKVKAFSGDSEDKYCITSAREIAFTLRDISERRRPVALYYGNANEFILATLLFVETHGLWLEQSPDGAINQKISASDDLIVVGSHLNVKIQFSSGKPSLEEHRGYKTFFLPLPEKLFRLQRREYFRLTTPATNPLKCVIASKLKTSKLPREVTVMDISIGGIGVICSEDDTELLPGISYPECRIDLPEFGTIIGKIVVKNMAVLTGASGQSFKRAGCELLNLDNPSKVLLHRYVLHLQRVK